MATLTRIGVGGEAVTYRTPNEFCINCFSHLSRSSTQPNWLKKVGNFLIEYDEPKAEKVRRIWQWRKKVFTLPKEYSVICLHALSNQEIRLICSREMSRWAWIESARALRCSILKIYWSIFFTVGSAQRAKFAPKCRKVDEAQSAKP